MCIQAIFNTFDTFEYWLTNTNFNSTSTKQCARLSKYDSIDPLLRHGNNISLVFNTCKEINDKHHFGFYKNSLAAIQLFQNSIPIDLLIQSSMNSQAYARSLRYLENFIRARSLSRETNVISSAMPSQSSIFPLSIIPHANRNDGSSSSLPRLSDKQLDLLLQIFANLNDSDSLHGSIVLKQIFGYPINSRDRILEYIQTDEWMNAYFEYNQSHERGIVNYNSHVYKSKLRCLIELLQYENVIDQTFGIANANNQKRPSHHLNDSNDRDEESSNQLLEQILPLGIEAAWKLSKWDDLDTFIHTLSMTSTKPSHSLILSSEEDFQIKIGKALLEIHKKDEVAFNKVIVDLRRQTMMSLSAAAMESYQRAYPMMLRLHCIHDLQKASSLMLQEDPKQKKQLIQSLQWNQRLDMTTSSPRQRSTILDIHRSVLTSHGLNEELADHWFLCSG